jgi:ankyrin repeat protein
LGQAKETSTLLYALERGDSDQIVRCLLDNGSNPDYMDDNNISLLMYTVGTPQGGVTLDSYFDSRYTKLLIGYGADVNQKGISGYTALDCAILYKGNRQCERVLLDADADISSETVKIQQQKLEENVEGKQNMLADADSFARSYHSDIVYDIFTGAEKRGIEVNMNSVIKNLIMGDIEQANKTIRVNDVSEKYLKTIIYLAAAHGNTDTLEGLEKRFKDIYNINDGDENLLFISSANGNIETTEYFVKKGFDVNGANYVNSILDCAVMNNHMDVAQYLLQQGARPSVITSEDNDTNTLSYAVRAEASAELTKLVYENSKGAINGESMFDAMCEAIMYQKMDAMKYLLEQSKHMGISYETELLVFACGGGPISRVYKNAPFSWDSEMLDFVKLLIESGATIQGISNEDDEKDSYGEPLYFAVKSGDLSVVNYMIEYGADVNTLYSGEAPLTAAVSQGYFDIVKLLIENGAKINNGDEDFGDYDDLLDFAKEYGGNRIYKYLVSVSE